MKRILFSLLVLIILLAVFLPHGISQAKEEEAMKAEEERIRNIHVNIFGSNPEGAFPFKITSIEDWLYYTDKALGKRPSMEE